MSVTISQQPEDYTPCYNPQIFVGLSNQVAQPNFEYTIVVQDIISGQSETFPTVPRPDDYVVFDASFFAKQFMTSHFIPENEYGWEQSDSIRKIRVNIGETYGATPVYSAGTNIDYIVWNGVLNEEDFPDYDPDNYVYRSNSTTNIVFLSGTHDDVTYPGKSNFFYALTSEAGDILQLNIDCYDSSGAFLHQSVIPNPHEASTTYTDKYLCIDIGHKGLSNIANPEVTGTYPIITPSVAYYTVTERCITGGPPASQLTPFKRIDILDEPRYEVFTLHYLAKSGAFETCHFARDSRERITSNKTYFKKHPYAFDSGTYTHTAKRGADQMLSASSTRRVSLTTHWLSQEQIDCHQQIIDSPLVYLDRGDSLSYIQVKVLTDEYLINQNWNSKLFQLQIEIEYNLTSHRQV